jgi:hypothetical protein
VPLCSPLQYPSVYTRGNEGGPYLGAVTFYGRFALTFGYELQGSPPYPGNQTWSLRRCRSKLNLVIDTNTQAPSDPYPINGVGGPIASSRAVVVTRELRRLSSYDPM